MQFYIDVFLLQDNRSQFFLWNDHELCPRVRMMINNLIKENMPLQEEIKHMKKSRHCGHDQFSL